MSSQGDTFPEITKKVDEIKEILDEEEASFSLTLDRGEKLFDQFSKKAKQQGSTQLSGVDVWRLYDTYGFPADLTRLMAEEHGLTINEKEFEDAQAQSKEASKATNKKGGADVLKLDVHDIDALEKNDAVSKTDDSAKYRGSQLLLPFVADPLLVFGDVDAEIKAIYYNKSFISSTADIPQGAQFGLVLDKTSFYAESGGQEYDTGTIVNDELGGFEVTNCQIYNGYVLHTGYLKYGKLDIGTKVVSSYDKVHPSASSICKC
jgi:alanyl-tRNA synthetase